MDQLQGVTSKVSSQSERQLGAFILLWAENFKELPELLPDKQVSFRNEVIHKGKIPTRMEAIEYGNSVLQVLRPKLLTVQKQFSESVSSVIFYHLRESHPQTELEKHVSTMSIPTIVSLTIGESSHHEKSLDDHLIDLDKRRKITGSA